MTVLCIIYNLNIKYNYYIIYHIFLIKKSPKQNKIANWIWNKLNFKILLKQKNKNGPGQASWYILKIMVVIHYKIKNWTLRGEKRNSEKLKWDAKAFIGQKCGYKIADIDDELLLFNFVSSLQFNFFFFNFRDLVLQK